MSNAKPIAQNFASVVFRGTFRDYQQVVLENAGKHLQDGKIHIVAAPGSGKTVLGLELIRRLNAPTLVLSPSVTIRQQWGERFEERFLPPDTSLPTYVSFDLKEPRLITSVTYQALHAAMHHLVLAESNDLQDSPDEQSEGESEAQPSKLYVTQLEAQPETNLSGQQEKQAEARLNRSEQSPMPDDDVTVDDFCSFDVVAALKEANIKVICLDEAHHLRSEWHKTLTACINALGSELTIISLTATPPYDASSAEWKRYESLCGPIDEEIFVPELVIKKTLCPHQDYLYFNFPTEGEKEALKHYRAHVKAFLEDLRKQDFYARALRATGALDRLSDRLDTVLKHEACFMTLFKMAEQTGSNLPQDIKVLMKQRRRYTHSGTNRTNRDSSFVSVQSAPWRKSYRELENALQFVVDSPELFTEELSEGLKQLAAQYGLVERKRINLLTSKKISRALISSMGKLQSISQIVIAEQSTLKDSLRMLILTDFIRKEQLPLIGTDAKLTQMGAVPIFESVRRAVGEASRLALLSGSFVIVPNESREGIAAIAAGKQLNCSFRELSNVGYSEALFMGSNKNKVAVMTEALKQGLVTILIGTKSLLGEGWDSPCINALILASFVGSFMLSNQMRGRAIRVDKDQPDKTADIWHLVTLEPIFDDDTDLPTKLLYSGLEKERELDGDDWETIVRRFDCFMGPSYTEPMIESGIERITILTPPFDKRGIARINAHMVERAQDRANMAASWNSASSAGFYPVVERASEFVPAALPTRHVFFNALPLLVMLFAELLLGVGAYGLLAGRFVVKEGILTGAAVVLLLVLMVVLGVLLVRGSLKLAKFVSPKRKVTLLAEAMLASLRQAGYIKSLDAKIRVVASPDDAYISFGLRQATIYEQSIFAEAMGETLAPIDNPKYVLVKKKVGGYQYQQSYACPTVLAANKEDAQLLRENLSHLADTFGLVYTYNAEGREILWKCRSKSVLNTNTEIIRKLTTWET